MSTLEKANELLNLLRSGTGLKSMFGKVYFDDDINKILDIAINECKSTVRRKSDGSIKRFESDIRIEDVRTAIETFASDATCLSKGFTSNVFANQYAMGPAIEIEFQKNKNGKIELEEVFGTDINDLLGRDEERREKFVEKVIMPITRSTIDENDDLKNKHRIGRIVDKFLNKKMSYNDIVKNCEDFLREDTDIKPENAKEMAKYLVNTMQRDLFKNEIADLERNGDTIAILNDKRKGYAKMVYGMSNEAYEQLRCTLDDVGSRAEDIKDIYSNLYAQVEAEAIDLKGKSPEDIEKAIKEINHSAIKDEKKAYLKENGYRSINVRIGKAEFKLLDKNLVEPAMKNLTEEMKELIDAKDNLTKEEYIAETARIHFRFVKIHPFPDGNGRTARAISNMLLNQIGEAAVFRKEIKERYIRGTNHLHYDIMHNGETKYLKNLAYAPDDCKRVEDKTLYLLEEYLGMKCLKIR